MKNRSKSGRYLNVKNYIVYDLDENIVIQGDCYQVCERLDIVKSTVTKAVKNGWVVRRKYRIYEVKE